MHALVLLLDLAGTFVFALSGGMEGVKHRLDLFGVLVLSFVAGTTGGIARDVVIGSVPPHAIADWRYVAVSVLAGLITFFSHPTVRRAHGSVMFFDAAGLALFAVAGAHRALAFGLGPVAAALLGMVTGIGGGIARDVLVAEVPTVLRSELYAVAALAGAGLVVIGHTAGLPTSAGMAGGAVVCFSLRLVAMRRGWRLPTAKPPTSTP